MKRLLSLLLILTLLFSLAACNINGNGKNDSENNSSDKNDDKLDGDDENNSDKPSDDNNGESDNNGDNGNENGNNGDSDGNDDENNSDGNTDDKDDDEIIKPKNEKLVIGVEDLNGDFNPFYPSINKNDQKIVDMTQIKMLSFDTHNGNLVFTYGENEATVVLDMESVYDPIEEITTYRFVIKNDIK